MDALFYINIKGDYVPNVCFQMTTQTFQSLFKKRQKENLKRIVRSHPLVWIVFVKEKLQTRILMIYKRYILRKRNIYKTTCPCIFLFLISVHINKHFSFFFLPIHYRCYDLNYILLPHCCYCDYCSITYCRYLISFFYFEIKS